MQVTKALAMDSERKGGIGINWALGLRMREKNLRIAHRFLAKRFQGHKENKMGRLGGKHQSIRELVSLQESVLIQMWN